MTDFLWKGYTELPNWISDPKLESFYGPIRDPFDLEDEGPDDLPYQIDSKTDPKVLARSPIGQLAIMASESKTEEFKIALDAFPLSEVDIEVSDRLLVLLLKISTVYRHYDAIRVIVERWESENPEGSMSTATYIFTLDLPDKVHVAVARAIPYLSFLHMMIELTDSDSGPEIESAAIRITRMLGPTPEDDNGLIRPITQEIDGYRAYSTWSTLYEYSRMQIMKEAYGNVVMHEYIKGRMEMVSPWRNPPAYIITNPLDTSPELFSSLPVLFSPSLPESQSSPPATVGGKLRVEFESLTEFIEYFGRLTLPGRKSPLILGTKDEIKLNPRKIYPSLIGVYRDSADGSTRPPIEDQLDKEMISALKDGTEPPTYPSPETSTGMSIFLSPKSNQPNFEVKKISLPGPGSYIYTKEGSEYSATMVIAPDGSDDPTAEPVDGGPSMDPRNPFEDDNEEPHSHDGEETVSYAPNLDYDDRLPFESDLAITLQFSTDEQLKQMESSMSRVKDIVTLILIWAKEKKRKPRDLEAEVLHKLAMKDSDPDPVVSPDEQGFYIPNSRRIAEILISGMRTDGFSTRETMHAVRSILELQIAKLSRPSKIRLLLPYYYMKKQYALGDDVPLLRVWGPANPMVGNTLFGTDNCSRYGGCRMFLCNHFEPSRVFGDDDEEEEDNDFPSAAIIPRQLTRSQLPSRDQIESYQKKVNKRTYWINLDEKSPYEKKVRMPDTVVPIEVGELIDKFGTRINSIEVVNNEVKLDIAPLVGVIAEKGEFGGEKSPRTPEVVRETPELRRATSRTIQGTPELRRETSRTIQGTPDEIGETPVLNGEISMSQSPSISSPRPTSPSISSPRPETKTYQPLTDNRDDVAIEQYRESSSIPVSELLSPVGVLTEVTDSRSALLISSEPTPLPYGTPSVINIPSGTPILDQPFPGDDEDPIWPDPLTPSDGLPTVPVTSPPKIEMTPYGARVERGDPGLIGRSIEEITLGPQTLESRPIGFPITEGSPVMNATLPPSLMYLPPPIRKTHNYYIYPVQARDKTMKEESGQNDEPRWFRGVCDRCHLRIRRPCHAVRRPGTSGGWRGCYCSFQCVRNDIGDPNPLVFALIDYFENQMIENGIYDRLYPAENLDNSEKAEQDAIYPYEAPW